MGSRSPRAAAQEGPEAAHRAAPQQVRRRVSTTARVTQSPSSTRTSFDFPRSHRITRGPELRAIARTGKRLRTEHLDVRVVASLSHAGHARVGLVVPKHRHTAVERNRLKRRLREIARTRILPGAPAIDLVVTTRPSAYALSFGALLLLGEHIRREAERVAPKLLSSGAAPGAPG